MYQNIPPPGSWPVTNAPQQPAPFAVPTIFNTEATPIDKDAPARFASLPSGTKDEFLMRWQQAQQALAAAKDLELSYRAACAILLLEGGSKKEGVNNVELGQGYVAKVGVKFNRKLRSFDEKISVLDAVDLIAERMAEVSNEGGFIADRIFKWSVDISVTELRKLEEEAPTSANAKKLLDLVNSVLEVTEATPTLEIKEPKATKK